MGAVNYYPALSRKCGAVLYKIYHLTCYTCVIAILKGNDGFKR